MNLEIEDILVTCVCASHYFNILGKNVTADSVMASVVKIQKFLGKTFTNRLFSLKSKSENAPFLKRFFCEDITNTISSAL